MKWEMGYGDPYALLAPLLGERDLPNIRRTERGKPYLVNDSRFFSVSHSHGLALCAVADTEVGADIETIRPRNPNFPNYVLNEAEVVWFTRRGSRWADFYALWTLKEAVAKCTGEGIFHRPPREFSVPLLDVGESAVYEGYRFTALGGDGWRGGICQKEL